MRNEGAGIDPIAAPIWAAIPCVARVCGCSGGALADLWITLGRPFSGVRARGPGRLVRVVPVAVRCATRYKVAIAWHGVAARSGGSRTRQASTFPATDPI